MPATETSNPCSLGSALSCHLPIDAVAYPARRRDSASVRNTGDSVCVFAIGSNLRCSVGPRSALPTVYILCPGVYMPVNSEARLGAQLGPAEYASVNSMPCAARPSMCGVW